MIARSVGRSVGRSIGAGGFAVADGGAGYDTDAQAYITLVEAEDGESLETGVKDAINAFVVGCKSDGIWDAIKASCILAGARTLTGALVPLVGTAPTNNNFVSGDYNRETGLVGDGATKYLDSNRNNNADPQNDQHACVYRTVSGSGNRSCFGAGTGNPDVGVTAQFTTSGGTDYVVIRTGFYSPITGSSNEIGFIGGSRSASATYTQRAGGIQVSTSQVSQTPFDGDVLIFCRGTTAAISAPTNDRLSFYSIGESLNLALLDSRVSTLMTAIGAAIP